MTIADILKLDVNESVLGTFVVKTVKKSWEDTDGWMNQVVLSDNTGDMLADFHINVYQPIQRGAQIELVQAMTQHGTDGLRLYVETWKQAGDPISEPPEGSYLANFKMAQKEIANKIRCRYGEVFLLKYGKDGVLEYLQGEELAKIVEELMK